MNEKDWSRFWSKVSRGSSDSCWLWTGGACLGYGRFKASGRETKAHRLALFSRTPAPSAEAFACHTCDNKLCCNPAHLYWGDRISNARDAVERGRYKTLASHGRFVNVAGQRFGRLTARHVHGSGTHGRAMWMCDCSCGASCVVSGVDLRNGHVKSCGCAKRRAA